MPMTDAPSELARTVRRARLARGWRQADLAAEAGTTRNVIGMLESATDFRPYPSLLTGLASALDLDPDALFALAGRIPPDILDALTGDLARIKLVRRALAHDGALALALP